VFVDYGEARPGVKSIPKVNLSYDRSARKLNAAIAATADSGELVTASASLQVP
jgi:hypothetical protein